MSSIYDLLAQIKNAVYGKDVRDAIHDSIEQCYDDATGTPESIAGAVADIQSYKEQTDALISNYESQFNTMMADYEDRIDAQVDNLVANVKPNTVVNLWKGNYGSEPSGTINDVYTLSDDISNYDYIDIYSQEAFSSPVRVKVDSSGNTLAKLTCTESSGSAHPDNTYFILSETHISFQGNGNEGVVTYTLMVTDRNGTQTYDYNNTEIAPLTIERIDGIKVGADASAEVADIRVGEDGTVYQTAGAAVRGQIADVKQDLAELEGGGITDEIKQALMDIVEHIGLWTDDHGQDYRDALYDALYPPAPPKTVVSISAVYTQSGTVYVTDTLDSLKTDLVVTATYDDSTTGIVTAYTLSGTLEIGTSTITVSYSGKTTTFTVAVSEAPPTPLYQWENLGSNLVDSIGGITAITNGTQNNEDECIDFTASNKYINFGEIYAWDRTYIIEFGTSDSKSPEHARFFGVDSDNAPDSGGDVFAYRNGQGFAFYVSGLWGSNVVAGTTSEIRNMFGDSAMKVYIDSSGYAHVYKNGTLLGTSPRAFKTEATGLKVIIGSSSGDKLYNLQVKSMTVYSGEVV